jgi:hypothetical protein
MIAAESTLTTMKCQRCGKSITEYTFAHYVRRCVPCFQRMPLQRVRSFFTEDGFVVLVGLFPIPVFLLYELVRQLWQKVRPVPFKRHEILRLMTSHFGIEGATEYVNGFRCGFVERPSLKHCGTHHSRQSRAYIAGREDGTRFAPRTRAAPANS